MLYNGFMKTKEELLRFVYGAERTPDILQSMDSLQEKWASRIPPCKIPEGTLPLDCKDVVMISYGDSIRKEGLRPLQALKAFADKRLKGLVSGIHILPFSPYTSDDGFSVVDYRQINPDLGTWEDVEALGEHFKLMFDLVLNHCSVASPWFQGFLKGDPKYKDYFIRADPGRDLSSVFRPRAQPLLTEFETVRGKEHLWTTFSADQVDLNFANPDVLLEFLDIFLMYIARGGRIIRLDAIGFLWKEIGTRCMHHPKTHALVQLFRAVLNETAPQVVLLTETNVPHNENISYFGNGGNEAHMVYQFTLPPLVLDAWGRENTRHLTDWACSLPPVSEEHTFFNFMASHDGVGVLPSRGYLSEEELSRLIQRVKARGGEVSYKNTPQGEIPYELNINYRAGVNHPDLSDELKAKQFISSQAVMLVMAGVPGIYYHSLLGSGNWTRGVDESGIKRRINREKLDSVLLEEELDKKGSIRNLVSRGFRELLAIRRNHKAFDPSSSQIVLDAGEGVFALIRIARGKGESILCLQNAASRRISLVLNSSNCPLPLPGTCLPLTTGPSRIEAEEGEWNIILEAFDVCWAGF